MDALRGDDYMPRIAALCALLRAYRIESGMTQGELAERLGIAQTKVSRIELRERRLDVVEMSSYLCAMGKSLTDLAHDLEAEREEA